VWRWLCLQVISNTLALRIHASWAGLAGKLLQTGPTFRTVVPHGCTCEDMADTRDLPSFSVWGKPVHGSAAGKVAWAVTAINSVQQIQHLHLDLADLGFPAGASVQETDVWTGNSTIGGMEPGVAAAWTTVLAPGSHRFVLLEEV
jgi:hypothetical protein